MSKKAGLLMCLAAAGLFGCYLELVSASPGSLLSARLHAHYRVHPRSEEYVLKEVNRFRLARGLPSLKSNTRLREAARKHSMDMATLGYFSHEDLDGHGLKYRLLGSKLAWKKVAENIAKCRSSHPAQSAIVGWFQSPGHLHNILDSEFTETGIGAVIDPSGEVSFCQVFMAR